MKRCIICLMLLVFATFALVTTHGAEQRRRAKKKKSMKKKKSKKSSKSSKNSGARFFTTPAEGDQLLRINDATGRVAKVGSFKPKRYKQRGGITTLEYDDSDETVYGIFAEKRLVIVDPDKAKVTPVGTSLGGIKKVRGLAADHVGNLYAHTNRFPGQLLQVNKRTGKATVLFDTFMTDVRDLAYHIQSGRIHATDGSRIVTINPRDGTIEELGPVSGLPGEGTTLEGIAFPPTGENLVAVDNQKPTTLYTVEDTTVVSEVEANGKEAKKNRVTGGTIVERIEPVVCEGLSRRRSWRTTGCARREQYLRAVENLKKIPAENALGIPTYDQFTETHNATGDLVHFVPPFLHYHRWLVWKFEQALQIIANDCTLSLPYWDWEENPDFPEVNPLWRENTFGSTTGLANVSQTDNPDFDNTFCVNEGIADFRGFWKTTWGPPPQPGGCVQRIFEQREGFTIAGVIPVIAVMLNNKTFAEFDPVYSRRPHGAPHVYVGGHMNTLYSPDDPSFYPHHTTVDRHWAIWQDYWDYDTIPFEDLTEADYANDPQYPIDEPLPFIDNTPFFFYPGRSIPPTPRELFYINKSTFPDAIMNYKYVHDVYSYRFAMVSDYRATNNPDWIEIADGIPETIECGGNPPLPVGDTTDSLLPRRYNQLKRQNPGLTDAEIFVLLLEEYCELLGNPLFTTPEWLEENGFEGQEELFSCDSLL